MEKNTAKSERFEMRLDASTLEHVDFWRAHQPDQPSRAEAIRRLTNKGLRSNPVEAENKHRAMEFSNPQRLITLMLCDIFKHLKISSGFDPELIENALYGGHTWGLNWEYSGVFHDDEDEPEVVREVVDILDMWFFIQWGYEKLSEKSKETVVENNHGISVVFPGFDGNNEGSHLGAAQFLVKNLKRFESLNIINSHMHTLHKHRAMLKVFESIRPTLVGGGLSEQQLIELLTVKEEFYRT